jgi:hypothetical protein
MASGRSNKVPQTGTIFSICTDFALQQSFAEAPVLGDDQRQGRRRLSS